MSYVDKKEEEKEEKLGNPLKAIFAEDTIIENAEDVIQNDTDVNRKNAFKRAYDRLQALFPDVEDKKKKKKKEESKKEFDRNLNVRGKSVSEQTRSTSKEARTRDDEKTKGIERE